MSTVRLKRIDKVENRGGFQEKVFLIEVED
jgi:hypothetical protein